MSFILDALRKSDAERQRVTGPGLADARYAGRRSRRSVWIPLLVLVLLANLVFMGLRWFGPVPAPESAARAPAEAPSSDPAQPDGIRPLAREAEPLDYQPEPWQADVPEAPVVFESTAPPARPAGPTAPAVARTTAPPPAPAAAAPAAAPSPAASAIRESTGLPTVDQVIAAGLVSLPELNLDLHVYSSAPAGRFVVINSRRYNEGSQLTEGPSVEAITADGVVLASQGTRFVLPRR